MKEMIITLIPYLLLIIIAILIYIIFRLKKEVKDLKFEVMLARIVLKLREIKKVKKEGKQKDESNE